MIIIKITVARMTMVKTELVNTKKSLETRGIIMTKALMTKLMNMKKWRKEGLKQKAPKGLKSPISYLDFCDEHLTARITEG